MATSLKSQSIEKEFSNINNCIDIDVTALKLIPEFYLKRQYDSIELILDFVKIKCFETDALRIIGILIAIQNNVFNDSVLKPQDIYLIKKEVKGMRKGHFHDFRYFVLNSDYTNSNFSKTTSTSPSRSTIVSRLNSMFSIWSSELLRKPNLNSLEISILEHISDLRRSFKVGKNLFNEVGRRKHKNGILKIYNQYQKDYVLNNALYLNMGYINWRPQGESKPVYENKPGMFFKVGRCLGLKNRIDLNFGFRLGKSAQPLYFVKPDTSFSSRKASTFLLGIDYNKTIWRPNRKLDVGLLCGFGVEERDLFYTHYIDEDENDEALKQIAQKMGDGTHARPYLTIGTEINYFLCSQVAINTSFKYLKSGNFNVSNIVTNINGNSLLIQFGISAFLKGHPSKLRVFNVNE